MKKAAFGLVVVAVAFSGISIIAKAGPVHANAMPAQNALIVAETNSTRENWALASIFIYLLYILLLRA